MKKLIIAGAGGFGREVLGYALDILDKSKEFDISGFIDDNLHALDGYSLPYGIIGTIKDYVIKENDIFICAIGDPKIKMKMCTTLKQKGANFTNIIHPTCIIGRTSSYGQGLIMAPYSSITDNVVLGEFVTINVFSGFGHDAVAEDGCTLSAHCDITGFTHLEEGVFVGSNASVIPSVRVGRYSKVGAGSIVLKDVPDNVTVFGNPAKIIF